MNPTTTQNISIAVLYAKSDTQYWEELRRHVELLTNRYENVRIWTVNDITLGAEKAVTIRDELSKADITLLLLSADFPSKRVFDDETRILLQNYARQPKAGRYIMPVLVRTFAWQDHYDDSYDLENLTIFDQMIDEPEKSEAIYQSISEHLKTHIEEINARSLQVVIPTWAGFMGAIMYNDGFVKNHHTSLYKEYNRLLRFELNDSVEDTCQSMIAGEADMVWATMDRLPSVLYKLKDRDPRVVFLASWSMGADAIVARNGIETVADLKGKKIVYPFDSPAFTFLKFILMEHGLDVDQVFHQAQKQVDLDLLTTTFIHDETIDAIVIWSPFVEVCLADIPDARVLAHTGDYPKLIADVLVAPNDFVQLNREELTVMFSGWLEEIQKFGEDAIYKGGALGVLVEAIMRPLPSIIPVSLKTQIADSLRSYFNASLQKVHLCTLEDNLEFFGLHSNEGTPAPGKALYDRFVKMQFPEFLTDPAMQWEQVINTEVIKKVELGKKSE